MQNAGISVTGLTVFLFITVDIVDIQNYNKYL